MENKNKESGKSEDNRNDVVVISIGGKDYKIHRGNQKVAEIKELGGINPNHILVQIVNGQLIDLPNDGSVTIKGGEVFKSHPPVGDNS
jgi:hypothetical protein